MGTLLLFKNLYHQAFDDCKPGFLVIVLKVYTFFCLTMLGLLLYAFAYRVLTGYQF